jgi:hypothetical protein
MKASARALRRHSVAIPASRLPPPLVSYLVDRERWVLEAPYAYTDDGHRITVPQGFEFDLASVPRAFWSLIAPFELSIAAPLLHDFLYRYRGEPPAGAIEPTRRYSRLEADRLFRRVMEEEGVARWRRVLAYLAVRWLSSFAWAEGRPAPERSST